MLVGWQQEVHQTAASECLWQFGKEVLTGVVRGTYQDAVSRHLAKKNTDRA